MIAAVADDDDHDHDHDAAAAEAESARWLYAHAHARARAHALAADPRVPGRDSGRDDGARTLGYGLPNQQYLPRLCPLCCSAFQQLLDLPAAQMTALTRRTEDFPRIGFSEDCRKVRETDEEFREADH